MIETALAYIYSTAPRQRFVGCGAVIEGEWVATCRHVLRMALAEAGETADALKVIEIEFPHGQDENGAPLRSRATWIDDCTRLGGKAPDLVLIEPESIPDTIARLHPAMRELSEVGDGHAHVGLIGRDKANPSGLVDRDVSGEIRSGKDARGLRQFTGDKLAAYWTDRGASGSPVFVGIGEQLAGILSLSEIGVNDGKNALHEAAIVPGTTIRRHLELADFYRAASRLGVTPDDAAQAFKGLSAQGVPVSRMPDNLRRSVDEARARAAEPAALTNRGSDIDDAIGAAREKLTRLDVSGATELLEAKIAEEEFARRQRIVPLLEEKAAAERIGFDYAAAKATLRRLLEIEPDRVWSWIELGDIEVTTGSLGAAMQAFERAREAAQTACAEDPSARDRQRDLSVSFNKVGDVLVAQGDLAGALIVFREGMAIFEALSRADPGNAGWRRDLSVSFNKVGDVLVAQGELDGALKAFRDGLAIREALSRADPGNASWRRVRSVSYDRVADVLVAQGDLAGALRAFRDGQAIFEDLSRADPGNAGWRRDLSVSYEKVGNVLVAQGDLAGALKAFRDRLAIREALSRADPGNASWRRVRS
ncbi:tetratricopeptide repeat protein, partial [Roseiarcus sp.]|uniref:tetratricopeptide repeat protein n=1 Tax=Roseiarcus sp. TaxID=1969460 RepID=UPI003F99275F